MIGFWPKKSMSGKKEKISRMLYNITYNLHREGVFQSNWLAHVKDILEEKTEYQYT
jgi:hypothetical protein